MAVGPTDTKPPSRTGTRYKSNNQLTDLKYDRLKGFLISILTGFGEDVIVFKLISILGSETINEDIF